MSYTLTSIFSVLFLILTISGGCATQRSQRPNPSLDIAHLPLPTGTFAISIKKYELTDQKRPDPYFSDSRRRKLMIDVFYPVDQAHGQEMLPYLDSIVIENYESALKKGGLSAHFLRAGYPEISKNTVISKSSEKYPVIILSPGGGVIPEFYFGIISELVSHGFIVIGLNHTYNSFISLFSDESIHLNEPIFQQFTQKLIKNGEDAQGFLIKIHAEDLKFVLASLNTLELSKHMDLQNLGMLGHSLGGMAITYVCLNSPICKAGTNLDGALAGSPSSVLRAGNLTGDLGKPFLFLIGKKRMNPVPKKGNPNYINPELIRTLSKLENLTLEEYYEHIHDVNLGRLSRAAKKMGKKTSLIGLEKADHMSFSDWRIIHSYLLNPKEKSEEIKTLEQVISLVRNFFQKTLQHERVSLWDKIRDQKNLIIYQ